MSGNGFPKLWRFCWQSGWEGARSVRILLCVAIAPYMGARIETLPSPCMAFSLLIAPLVGARIETNPVGKMCAHGCIAPRVGARIETTSSTITPRVEQKKERYFS